MYFAYEVFVIAGFMFTVGLMLLVVLNASFHEYYPNWGFQLFALFAVTLLLSFGYDVYTKSQEINTDEYVIYKQYKTAIIENKDLAYVQDKQLLNLIKDFEKDKIIIKGELIVVEDHHTDITLILNKIKNENLSKLKTQQGLDIKSKIGIQE